MSDLQTSVGELTSDGMKRVLAAVGAVLKTCDRPDLDQRVRAAAHRYEQTHCYVLIAGEFKQGKSTLINALVNAPICPVDDDVSTARAIEIGYADAPIAEVVFNNSDPDELPETRPISFDDIPAYASDPPTAPDADQVMAVRIRLQRRLLSNGLLLVDTPGVGGLGSAHSTATVAALPQADAVLFVTDASQELTSSELEFLRTVRALCPTYACVVTKTDFYPSWRKIVDIDREHFERHGFADMRIFPTSAVLRQTAIDTNDREMNLESGYNELVAYLRDELASTVERASIHRLAAALLDVLADLETQLRAELTILDDPEEAARLLRQLEHAKERATQLRSQSARWQTTLGDGIGDLNSDVGHDLRGRLRELVREAEESLDLIDPAKGWDEFEGGLYKSMSSHIVQNFTFLRQRSAELAARVAQHFEADHNEIVSRLDVPEPEVVSPEASYKAALKIERPSAVSQTLFAIRGTAGGITTLSILSGVAGVSLVAPFVIVVGLALGRKLAKDERLRQVVFRRSQAKQAVRKYTDDISFSSTKDSNDALRLIQRQLRDHFLGRAEELTNATSESLAAAQQMQRSTEQARAERRKQIVVMREMVSQAHAVLADEVTG